jgi:uncharacterized SAM-binding protein YcdF (DUF218 family)
MHRFWIDILLQPFLVLLMLAGLGVLNLWRRRVETRRRLLLAAVPVVSLILVSTRAVAYFAVGSLEWPYPESHLRPEGADAIVVLSGYLRPPTRTFPKARLGADTLNRCLHAAELYSQGPRCLVVVSGGRMEEDKPGPTLAEAMADFLTHHGVAREDLLRETRSRSTYENAAETWKLLEPRGIRRIVLVTDAMHLRRAEECFRSRGFDVLPSGCDYRASEFEGWPTDFLPSVGAVGDMQRVLHEWVGIIYYRVRGWNGPAS